MKKEFKTVDEYIKTFPNNVQSILQEIRQTIRDTVPEAEETISYKIPTFKLNGKYLVYFAAWKSHIALYPIPPASETFNKEIAKFKRSKGTIQFPLDKPIPYDFIKKLVKFSVKENSRKEK